VTIGAVVFDATGTLFETAESVGSVYARAAAQVGVKLPAWRLDDGFRRVLGHAPPLGRAARPEATRAEREAAERAWWNEIVRQTFQATDSTVRFADPTAFARSLFDHYRRAEAWRERPGARALLAALRRAGRPIGLASQFDHRLPEILEALDLTRFFDAVEIPCTGGRCKPDRAVFEALAAGLGVPLDALAYVGDDAPEVFAAIAAHGIAVFDVRAHPGFAGLAPALGAEAGDEAAKLGTNAEVNARS